MIRSSPLWTPCRLSPVRVKPGGKGCHGDNLQGILLYQEHVLLWYETAHGRTAQERNNTFSSEAGDKTPASENDLTVFKSECVPYLAGKIVLADKIYSDFFFFNEDNPVKVFTPHKEIKGEPEVIKQREKTATDLFSKAVS